MGFSRQEYWSGFPFPPPGDLSDPGVDPSIMSFLDCWQILYCLSHFYYYVIAKCSTVNMQREIFTCLICSPIILFSSNSKVFEHFCGY